MTSADRGPDRRTEVQPVTAIIVTRNRADLLRRSIRSVCGQRPTTPRLIVVDDASTDHTSRVLREECPHATVIRLARNVGWAAARNIAAKAAESEVLFFVDDDSELAPDAVALAAQSMSADERIGALVASIIEDGKPVQALTRDTRFFTNVCIGQGVLRRSAFVAAGPYPPDFFYAEEVDLSLRLLNCGYHIVCDPAVVIFHAPDQRTRRPWPDVETHRNMLRVVLMRAPLWLLLPWAAKKLYDTLDAAFRTGHPRVIGTELLSIPATVIRSLRRRRPIPWEVFAVWRYLAGRQVTDSDYRRAALHEYTRRLDLLMAYVHNAATRRGASA